MHPTHSQSRLTPPRSALGVAGLLLAAGCATAPAPAGPTPADIPALEARRAQQPDDPAVNLRLGEAYYAAQRFGDARTALGRTLYRQPDNTEAQIYLGYTYEGLARFDSARAVYTRLEAAKPSGELRRLLNGRLELVARHEMLYQARQALAQESTLARTPPPSNTVAVMPFRYLGSDSTYQPLTRGLAALVVTDLGRVHSLRLVERERLQALMDEMKLGESGRVDPATGARSGRLIGASQVVQGQFDVQPTQIRMNAAVVRASDAQIAATGTGSDRLQALFDVEKQVVFQLLDKLGIAITPAERVAISERPTRDIQAFLLYSRGITAQDQGNYAAATQAFQAAVQRDPGFGAAQQGAQSSQQEQSASGTSASGMASAGSPPPAGVPTSLTLTSVINNTVPSGAGGLPPDPNKGSGGDGGTAGGVITPPGRPSGLCEAQNCAGPQNTGLIGSLIIIIQRP